MFLRQRVEANGEWSLFCPSEAPGLADTWGAEFEALYAKYEAEGRAKKVIRAQSLWFAIMDAQASVVTSESCRNVDITSCAGDVILP
jgi:ribonucleotide reductase alpha subunit